MVTFAFVAGGVSLRSNSQQTMSRHWLWAEATQLTTYNHCVFRAIVERTQNILIIGKHGRNYEHTNSKGRNCRKGGLVTMRLSDFLVGVGRPVAYYPGMARALGDMKESVFVCQMAYWKDKGDDPEGWIYKTAEEIEQETALSYKE